ncbi:Arm DNA-binding domain-containing protein [Janthinobacterium sp. JC611]|uniref:tyrosine-type recombinase/integrase n=1 Tax=Janthinobacterium sp. JC611 TaxID=2816201 RepID=UPI0033422FB5
MARTVEKLTALAVSKAKTPGYFGDGAGLYLQVSKTGTKSWIFRYTRERKQREMGLGAVHTVTLAEARGKARDCRALLLEGKDPLETRAADKLTDALDRARAITFNQCASAYIAAHRGSWKNVKHAEQWENTLATYAAPFIGDLPVAAVDTGLVVKVLRRSCCSSRCHAWRSMFSQETKRPRRYPI